MPDMISLLGAQGEDVETVVEFALQPMTLQAKTEIICGFTPASGICTRTSCSNSTGTDLFKNRFVNQFTDRIIFPALLDGICGIGPETVRFKYNVCQVPVPDLGTT